MPPNQSSVDLDIFNALVSNIYDAAMDVALWPQFMKRLTQLLNAKSGMLRVQDLRSKDVGTCVTLGLDPEFQRLYKEHYVHIDPIMPVIDGLEAGTIIQTVTGMPKSFIKTEFYNDYALPQGMTHTAGCCLVKNNSRVAVIGIHRPSQAGYYEPHELELLKLLIPHLQRAFQINSHLMQLTDKADAARCTLNRISTGIILVDSSGKPVFVNDQAETMLAKDCGLKITWKGLVTTTRAHTQELHKLISEASQFPHTGGALSISGLPHSLNILVIPINKETDMDFGVDTSQATAALFIGTTGKQLNFSLDVLCHFFGLTYAEARLAGALANGSSLEEIAENFNLSKNTVRSQLRSCFRKTGVNQQTQLVKLILCDPAALINDRNIQERDGFS